ncbi:hypothetical protein IAS59_004680 [Cryptococcus gattii]
MKGTGTQLHGACHTHPPTQYLRLKRFSRPESSFLSRHSQASVKNTLSSHSRKKTNTYFYLFGLRNQECSILHKLLFS